MFTSSLRIKTFKGSANKFTSPSVSPSLSSCHVSCWPPPHTHLSLVFPHPFSLPQCQSEFHFSFYVNITVTDVEKVHQRGIRGAILALPVSRRDCFLSHGHHINSLLIQGLSPLLLYFIFMESWWKPPYYTHFQIPLYHLGFQWTSFARFIFKFF